MFALIKENLPGVLTGSTAPPFYMKDVPNADFAFGQFSHNKPHSEWSTPLDFFSDQAVKAHSNGLLFVASINANTNSIDNLAFFYLYNAICKLIDVDFVTSWQWPQGNYEFPSFESRINNDTAEVQSVLDQIPDSCKRD